jgi:hypothetical protein
MLKSAIASIAFCATLMTAQSINGTEVRAENVQALAEYWAPNHPSGCPAPVQFTPCPSPPHQGTINPTTITGNIGNFNFAAGTLEAFNCPVGSVVTGMTGSYGSVLTSMKFTCSNGATSKTFGAPAGTGFAFPTVGSITKMLIDTHPTDGRVAYIAYGGYGTGTQYRTPPALSVDSQCPVVGVDVKHSNAIDGLRLRFRC